MVACEQVQWRTGPRESVRKRIEEREWEGDTLLSPGLSLPFQPRSDPFNESLFTD